MGTSKLEKQCIIVRNAIKSKNSSQIREREIRTNSANLAQSIEFTESYELCNIPPEEEEARVWAKMPP